jgi:hypothetical protein
MARAKKVVDESTAQNGSEFVFMEKSINILNVGFTTGKNIVLYGPGGHGKSELTLSFLRSKNVEPYVITMGTGMTTDRLFGGLDIPTFEKTGKIEYLVQNSFMNHEYVVFEELFDAPDFILEQLKDILSSKVFRNGTQVFPIKTKFIVCCTNRTRDEFSKNMSLKALMERFPLELNVIWDNYTEISYNKLLESKFGEGNVDPVIPFLLQEYHGAGITISPRVAVIAYQLFSECGPDSLTFLAEFAKKPDIIKDALKKYENTISFRVLSAELGQVVASLQENKLLNSGDKGAFDKELKLFAKKMRELKALKVTDELVATHTELVKGLTDLYVVLEKKSKVQSIME